MSYALPLSTDPRRDMFDMADLVAIGKGDALPLGLQEALQRARRIMRSNPPAIRRLFYIVMRADDQLLLISVGRRGGWKLEWDFGPYSLPAKLRH